MGGADAIRLSGGLLTSCPECWQIVGYSVERGYNAPSHAFLWTLRNG